MRTLGSVWRAYGFVGRRGVWDRGMRTLTGWLKHSFAALARRIERVDQIVRIHKRDLVLYNDGRNHSRREYEAFFENLGKKKRKKEKEKRKGRLCCVLK